MFLETITIIETMPCHAEIGTFKAITKTSVSLTELLPYLNSVVEKPIYTPVSGALVFSKGKIGFAIQDDNISVIKFVNMTEVFELLDWLKDLINDTYDRKAEITPNYKGKKFVGVLKIYNLLPQKNCKECGEKTCMAFANKINSLEAAIDDCPLMLQVEYQELRDKLIQELI